MHIACRPVHNKRRVPTGRTPLTKSSLLPGAAVHRLRLVQPSRERAHARFVRLRRDCHLAFLAWVREQPATDDVALEIDASISVLRQLARLGSQL
jgi:hypothetical protein